MQPIGRGRLVRRVALLPLDLVRAGAGAAAETARYLRGPSGHAPPLRARPTSVLAIWVGAPGATVGGSVTHVSGILGGLCSQGLRVGLVTVGRPPEQLTRVVDDIEIASPLPPYARLTNDVECLAVNRHLHAAARALSQRLEPSFVYQRHQPLLRAGLEVARAMELPFVLEWNSSEIWTRSNWSGVRGVGRLFDPLIASIERDVLEHADLVVAVSRRAAEMALKVGGVGDNVVVVPNGVDLAEVTPATRESRAAAAPARVGWIGSFGPWHGAEVLVRALAELPQDVGAVMIGDGAERARCEQLASSLGVLERIEWTGTLPHARALERLRACDVLASPHTPLPGEPFFGSPTKLFEYMALARPIVASSLEQIGEVLEDGRTARLVPPGDASALAATIREVLDSPDRGESLARNARAEAEAHHGWERRAASVLAALRARAGSP